MIYIALIVIFAYSVVLMFLFFQLMSNKQFLEESLDKEFVTILIPVRNEQQNVPRLIENLKKLDYCCFEVIVVDDHSEDETAKLLLDANLPFLRVLHLLDNLRGKKNAIKYGLTYCKGSWIVFSDADVDFSTNWIKTLSSFFNRADFILAPVLTKKSSKASFLNYFETIDVLAMQAITCAATNAKYPFLASAANMAVRKDVAIDLYQQIDTSIPSGDDVFLLHEYLKGSNRVCFVTNEDARVFVPSSTSWYSFFKQRLRWVSKAKYYRNANALFFSWLIFLAHILPIFAFIEVLFFDANIFLFLSILLTKFLIDTAFVVKSLRIFKLSAKLLLVFPLVCFFYFFYISFVPVLSLFVSVKWKNRSTN